TRNWSTVISVRPILATVERPKPRKMSPIPQIAKLITRNPTTAAITTLPSQLEEAFRRPRSMHRPWVERAPHRGRRRAAHHRERPPASQHDLAAAGRHNRAAAAILRRRSVRLGVALERRCRPTRGGRPGAL